MPTPLETTEIKRRAMRGIGWVGLETWGGQVLRFLVYILLARLVGPDAFGIIALASVFLSVIEILVRQGFGDAIIQRDQLEDDHIDAAFWLSSLAGALFAALTFLIAPVFARWYSEPGLVPVVRWLSLTFLFTGVCRMPEALLTRGMSFQPLAIRSLLGICLGGAVGLVAAYLGYGVWSLVAQQLTTSVVGVITLWCAVSWRPRLKLSLAHARQLYGFALKTTGNNLLWAACKKLDQAFVGYFFGSTALGAYSLAGKTTQMLSDCIVTPIAKIAFPAFSKLQGDPLALKNGFCRGTEMVAFFCLPAFAGLFVLSSDVVAVFFGAKWISVIPFLQAFCVYAAIGTTLGLTHAVFMAVGRPGVYFLQFVQLTILTAAGCWIASRWSAVAVAWSLVFSLIVHLTIYIPVLWRISGIPISRIILAVWKPAVPTVAMALAVESMVRIPLLNFKPLPRLCVATILGAIVYISLSLWIQKGLIRRIHELMISQKRILTTTGI